MGQPEVIQLLKKHKPKRLTAGEIAEKLGVGRNSINCNLKRMREGNFKTLVHGTRINKLNKKEFEYTVELD